MTPAPIDIRPVQLRFALVFVLSAQAVSFAHRLGLVEDLAVGTARTFLQLFLMGYALRIVFGLDMLEATLGVFLVVLIIAAATIVVLLTRKKCFGPGRQLLLRPGKEL